MKLWTSSEHQRQRGRFGVAALIAFALSAIPVQISSGATGPASTGSPIRGTLIDSPPQTNAPEPAAIQTPPRRRRRPKPPSVQHRMVEFRLNQAAGNEGQGAPPGGSPAKVIFSPAQLAAFPEVPLPPGYQRVGFETLSAFPFEVTREMAEGTNSLAAAASATWPTIPAAVKALDGRLVAIRGFLLPVKMNNGLAFEFLLLRNQNLCCFGSIPKINEWITVQDKGEGVKPIMDQPLTVLGRLHVGEIREQGYLVGLYRLDAERIILPQSN